MFNVKDEGDLLSICIKILNDCLREDLKFREDSKSS